MPAPAQPRWVTLLLVVFHGADGLTRHTPNPISLSLSTPRSSSSRSSSSSSSSGLSSLTPRATFLSRSLRLQSTVNSMVKRGRWDRAGQLLETHIYDFSHVPLGSDEREEDAHCAVARSFLLLALHCQREGNVDAARAAFREGAERFEAMGLGGIDTAYGADGAGEEEEEEESLTSKRRGEEGEEGNEEEDESGCEDCRRAAARLYQSWGLLESKQGHSARAFALVMRAVKLDPSLSGVLRWRMWNPLQPGDYRWPEQITDRVVSKTIRDTPRYFDSGFLRTEIDTAAAATATAVTAGGSGSGSAVPLSRISRE